MLFLILINVKVIESPKQDNNFSQEQNKKFNELSMKKIGRNEPCPCNSGKKYKHCCGSL